MGDEGVKYYKIPLDGTPSLLNDNLSSAICKCEESSAEGPRCLLLYSSGLDYYWLHTKASTLRSELGESKKENRYDGDNPGAGDDGALAEGQVVKEFVLEEYVDNSWTKRRGCSSEDESKSQQLTSTSSLQRQNSAGISSATQSGIMRVRQARFHRITSRHTAVVACVSNMDVFEVEFYSLLQTSSCSDWKCILQTTFTPGSHDPTEEWRTWNAGKKGLRRPCYTQGSCVVYQLEEGSLEHAEGASVTTANDGNLSFLDLVEKQVCVGCSSGDTFVFQVVREGDDDVEIPHLATLSSTKDLRSGPAVGAKVSLTSTSPVACLCSLEEAHLVQYAAGKAGRLSDCVWANLLFVGHEDGTIVLWMLEESKASVVWRTNVSSYLDSFTKVDDALVSMKLLATTNQLVVCTLSGHMVLVNFDRLTAETRATVAEDSRHLLKLRACQVCVSSVEVSRIHAGWITGVAMSVVPGSGKNLVATCAQDGTLHLFQILREAEEGATHAKCLFSHSMQFYQFTGISFLRCDDGGVKLAASSYEDGDMTVFHVDL
ncbi:hypothetical protein A3770_14p71930 [Chloropicon primus]|uniref:WD40 repeat domain-containing protein n=1 Tax=Chloropicon primus TaxID=1764295 RepID=A0A5B8MYG8_9CHLO|nr:hypothetical protein A3770_14p71930 [Chloropicon primus]|eukprot:QDZ24675.1 hypothetical protein A3770_14p71930 [Chloropicon primus]